MLRGTPQQKTKGTPKITIFRRAEAQRAQYDFIKQMYLKSYQASLDTLRYIYSFSKTLGPLAKATRGNFGELQANSQKTAEMPGHLPSKSNEAGPSTQHLRSLAPQKIHPQWSLGPEFLNVGYLDPCTVAALPTHSKVPCWVPTGGSAL